MSMKRQRICILGISVDSITMADAVAQIIALASVSPCRQVVTVNPEFIMAARRDPAFAAVLNNADLAVPDGAGLIWAARRRGRPLPERVAGVDIVENVAAVAARQGLRVFLLGAQEGVAAAAAAVLSARYPGLIVAGTFAGSPAAAEDAAIVTRVNEAQAAILFVAYGAPRQDLWIERNRARLRAGVAVGVGGAFDFISGRSRRAPRWMQQLGLEWLHRLYHEPWRWRRMLALPRFVWAVLRET
jgi:N-acetylglucosaminyldiphosphoundecaprenol N-acetyl-beta-D-mannosaminyltransferase